MEVHNAPRSQAEPSAHIEQQISLFQFSIHAKKVKAAYFMQEISLNKINNVTKMALNIVNVINEMRPYMYNNFCLPETTI